jgi:hypothetical protein
MSDRDQFSRERKMIDAIRKKNGDGWLQIGHVYGHYVTPRHWDAIGILDAWVTLCVESGTMKEPNVWELGNGYAVIQARSSKDARVFQKMLDDLYPQDCPVQFSGRLDGKLFRFVWDPSNVKDWGSETVSEVVTEIVEVEESSDEDE